MADVVTKSVRLMDKAVRLYPRVKLEDIVKSVTADGTETVVKLVEQSNNENIVYGTKVTGGLLQQATITYSESLKGSTIPVRTAGGMLLVENPSSDTPQAAVNLLYANTTYGRLGAGNDWTGTNRFTSGLTVGNNLQYAKYSFGGVSVIQKNSDGTSATSVLLGYPAKNGTFALMSDVSASASTTLTSANAYTDTQINAKLSSALKYKGSKDTYADLPKTGNQVGDVWNVVAAYGNAHAGTNWAWNGTIWDPLGGTVDLTNYVTAPAAFTTAGMIVVVNKAGLNREIKESTYAPGSMTAGNHPAAMLPTAQSVFEFVDGKLSGSIWDSSKVVYGETESTDTTWGTASMVLASRLEDGHMLAKEAYRVQTTMTTTETHDTLPTSKAVLDFVMTRTTELGQLISLKVDKKTTTGTFAYAHVGGTQTEFLVTPETAVSSIVYRDSAGRTKAFGPIATLSTATATNVGVVISDADRDYVITGSILQSLVTRINSSLGLINNSLITYEEVSA
jgi:hypothetical protein